MNIPEIKLERDGFSDEQLFSALSDIIADRNERFSPTVRSTEADLIYFDFEDSREEPPVWAVRLTLSKKGLFATLTETLDSDIGEEFYRTSLEQTMYVIMSLFDARAEQVALRRIKPL